MLSHDPIEEFLNWFGEATQKGIAVPEAMTLSTATKSGRPSGRVVLYKGIKDGSFFFVTNFDSRKGRELAKNPWASLTFYWPGWERQVRIEGKVTKCKPSLSDEYWETRPRDSQVGAWASKQSKEIPSREFLEEKIKVLTGKFEGKAVPRPKYWGGYLVKPTNIEFWVGQASRLHDRFEFTKTAKGWKSRRLSP